MKRKVLSILIVLVLITACTAPTVTPDPPAECSPEPAPSPEMPGTPPPPGTAATLEPYQTVVPPSTPGVPSTPVMPTPYNSTPIPLQTPSWPPTPPTPYIPPTLIPSITSTMALSITWPPLGEVYEQAIELIDGTIGVIANDLTDLVDAVTVDAVNFLWDAQDKIPKFVGVAKIFTTLFEDFGILGVMFFILILVVCVLVFKALMKLIAWIIQVFPFKGS